MTSSNAATAPVVQQERVRPVPRVPFAHAGDGAWLVALPCAAIAAIVILLAGPPLGRLAFHDAVAYRFWPESAVAPEPTEAARYLIAAAAPLLLALATVAVAQWRPRMPRRLMIASVAGAQVVALLAIAACFAGQRQPRFTTAYFSDRTLAVAAAVAVALGAVATVAPLRSRCVALLRESIVRRAAALVIAIAMTAAWLLPAVNSDESIAWAHFTSVYHVPFVLDETFAVLNGLTPLVDFSAQYGSLWPYLIAVPMLLFGKTLLLFTIAMAAVSALALLAIFGVLRRATRNSVAALLLYLPFLATSFFIVDGESVVRHSFGTYFPMYPLRYGGPYLLAWLVARQLDRRESGVTWLAFAAAGLVTLNNLDFGIPACGATVVAALWTTNDRRARSVGHLLAGVVSGMAAALALVSAVTLVRAGALPDLGRLVEFARIYGVGGFNLIPLPGVVGLPLAIFLTYVAAIGVATVRAIRHAHNRVLTGMLAWSGVFGIGSGAYYMGRSYYEVLPYAFSAWTLALALLAIAVLRHAAHGGARRLDVAGVAVLFGMGIALCSVAQLPTPWQQHERITTPPADASFEQPYVPVEDPPMRRFVSSLADGPRRFVVKKGAPVGLLMTTGHRIADAYGIVNVIPYTGYDSINTLDQVNIALRALRSAGGNTLVLPDSVRPSMLRLLMRRGFALVTPTGLRTGRPGEVAFDSALNAELAEHERLTKWVDTRNLHPRVLREQ